MVILLAFITCLQIYCQSGNILLCCILYTDLEWKLIYVGSAEDETYDQLLESVLVGPVNIGNYRFVFQANALPTEPLTALKSLYIYFAF